MRSSACLPTVTMPGAGFAQIVPPGAGQPLELSRRLSCDMIVDQPNGMSAITANLARAASIMAH